MPELRHLTRAKPTTSTIDLGDGDTVTLTFDANRVTPHWMDEAMQRVTEQDMLSLAKALASVLISWDVTSEGAEFPPTAANISVLSFPVVNSLFETVCRSAAPSDAEGNASSPSASEPLPDSGETSQSSPNGSDTSSLPAPSAAPS